MLSEVRKDKGLKKERDKDRKKDQSDKKRKRHSTSTTELEDSTSSPLPASKPKKPRTNGLITPIQETLTTPSTAEIADPNSPFKLITTKLYLPISPIYSSNPWLSLESDHLDPLILTYFPPLKGIVFAYRNIRFLEAGARVAADSPFAYTWVSVDFLVWCPKKGGVLEGWVNLQSESHVGLLVLNTFNASVPRGKIPVGWRWCEKREGWEAPKVKVVRMGKKSQGRDAMEGIDGPGAEETAEAEEEDREDEEEEIEEDTGGWRDSKGNCVDGLLRFKVESVKASGHIIAIEGSFLGIDGNSEEGQSEQSRITPMRSLPLRLTPTRTMPPRLPVTVKTTSGVAGGSDEETALGLTDTVEEQEGEEDWDEEREEREEEEEQPKKAKKSKETQKDKEKKKEKKIAATSADEAATSTLKKEKAKDKAKKSKPEKKDKKEKRADRA